MPRLTIFNMMRGIVFVAVTLACVVQSYQLVRNAPTISDRLIAASILIAIVLPLAWIITALALVRQSRVRDFFVLANFSILVLLVVSACAAMTCVCWCQGARRSSLTLGAFVMFLLATVFTSVMWGLIVFRAARLIRPKRPVSAHAK